MKRLGYACLTKTLDNVTSSSSLSYTNYLKNENKLQKLDEVIISNLEDLEKIIDYNIANDIHFYRLSSKIIPLATHKDVEFDYIDKYQDFYDRIGEKIKKSNMRVDFHPDQFCVLNSTNKDVVENSFRILEYHYNILEALKIKLLFYTLVVMSLEKNNQLQDLLIILKNFHYILKNVLLLKMMIKFLISLIV